MRATVLACSLAVAALALLAVPARADDAPGTMHGMGGSTLPMPNTQGSDEGASHGTQSPADRAMMQDMQAMQHAMAAAPQTGDPDHDFVAMMIPHHQGAVDMARVELQYGKDPELLALARDIVAAQEKEIGFMQGWLAKHPGK